MSTGKDRSPRGYDDDLAKITFSLSVLSNSVRARTIASPRTGKASFTELLGQTGLDPTRQCSLLDYHP